MQSTIVISFPEVQRDFSVVDAREEYDCRLAAMRKMVALMDCGCGFVVEHIPHANVDAEPIRSVTLWDDAAVR